MSPVETIGSTTTPCPTGTRYGRLLVLKPAIPAAVAPEPPTPIMSSPSARQRTVLLILLPFEQVLDGASLSPHARRCKRPLSSGPRSARVWRYGRCRG